MIHSSDKKHEGITFNLLAPNTELENTNESLKEGREFVRQEKKSLYYTKFL